MRPVPVTFLRFAFSDQLSVMRPCQRLTLGEKLGGKPKDSLAAGNVHLRILAAG